MRNAELGCSASRAQARRPRPNNDDPNACFHFLPPLPAEMAIAIYPELAQTPRDAPLDCNTGEVPSNDRKRAMTQSVETPWPFARIALVAATLAAAFAVGYAVSRGGSGDAGREAAEHAGAFATIESLEERAKADPDDSRNWQELGLAYFSASRFGDAARAYGKAVALSPEDALTWSALGEARVMASERDPMPADALHAFERAAVLDPKDPRARYFLAVKRDLDGDHRGAIADWLALLEETPEDAPWHSDLVRTIEQVGKINGIEVAGPLADAGAKSPKAPPLPAAARAIPGPTAEDLAVASQIPPGEQRRMAEGMVARLEQRLRGDPSNVDGWIMLIRSRVTLGQPEKAARALRDALEANPSQSAELRRQAGMLGVK
jgi:cytochrome c-type biogenesis protein CcmH